MFEERKPLLLIVADDLRKLTELDSLLGRKGYLVTTCSTHEDAEKAVAGKKVDLVIVSKMGEEGDEQALIWKVKRLSPAARSLLLHEATDWASSVAPLDSGADELLAAPYSDADVLRCVEQLLSAPPSP